MNVLVTGASGFIGQHLVNLLRTKRHCVIPTSRVERAGYIALDPFDSQNTLQIIKRFKVQTVINLAWHANESNYASSKRNFSSLSWNSQLFEVLRVSGIKKIISIGSSVEYFTENSTEIRNAQNFSRYALAKSASHKSFKKIFLGTDIQRAWLRVFQVYGPGQPSNRFIPTLCDNVKNRTTLTLNSPYSVRDWIDVRDVASAIFYIMESECEAELDVGTANGLANIQICEQVSQKFNLKWKIASEDADLSPVTLVASKDSALFKYFRPKRELFDYLDRVLT